MFNLAIVFLLIAIGAAVFGFNGVAGTAATISKVFFLIFFVLALVAFFL